ncbi:MAG TPA: TonB-dependent receptor [Steroidobacteraceae bacterium]|nr:TonB-dependent receptor [Steroidobacteraceae bacterium]
MAVTVGGWAALPAAAQSSPPADQSSPLQEVTVTASKMAVTQQQMSQASTVVTNEQILDQAQTSLTDTLRAQPGIQFETAGGPGQALSARLRGFSDSTLYVFDGITLNAGGTGGIGYLLGQIDPTMVQRIEVLRGPRATLYGADTTSGVIALSTLEGDHPESDIALEGGSLDWRKLRAGTQDRIAAGDGTWSYSLNGSWVDSGGVNRWEFYKNSSLVGRTTYRSGNLEIGGSFYATDNEFQNADLIESIAGATQANYFAVQIPDPSDVDHTLAGVVSLWFEQQLSPALSQRLTVGGSGQDFSIHNGDYANGGLIGYYRAPYDGWTDPDSYLSYDAGQRVPVYQYAYSYKTLSNNDEADYNLRYRTDAVSAVFGATYLGQIYDEGGSAGGSHEAQATRSVYGDAVIALAGSRLHAELGARLDSYTEWTSQGTYSAGLTYEVVPDFTLYANYGTSFTQPTLDQLYNPDYGNRRVTPENAATLEGGARARGLDSRWSGSLTYWHSYVSNVIAFDYSIYNPREVGDYGEYANAAAERSQGVEIATAYRIVRALALTANYTRTDAYLTGAAGLWSFMVGNARNMGNVGLAYQVERFDIGTNWYLTDHRLRWAGDVWAPGYDRLDLYGRVHLSDRLDLYGRIQNALDRKIVETLGYRNPGIYAVGGANYRF